MHVDELWQEYTPNGERLLNGGRPAGHGNPELSTDPFYGVTLIWLYRHTTSGIELLFQQRSAQVDRFAGDWDFSAGGHINYQEPVIEAAIREAHEEIGITVTATDLHFGYTILNGRKAIWHVYFCDWTNRPDNFHFDDQEVSAVRWVPLPELDAFLDQYAKPPLKADVIGRQLLKAWFAAYGDSQKHQ